MENTLDTSGPTSGKTGSQNPLYSNFESETHLMADSTDKKKDPKSTKAPEQKLGDTPVPPWEMPTPEEKAQAKPIRRALREAVAKVDSPEKAEEVIEKLETKAADQTARLSRQRRETGAAVRRRGRCRTGYPAGRCRPRIL